LAIIGIGPANTALGLVSDFTHINSSSNGTLLYSPVRHQWINHEGVQVERSEEKIPPFEKLKQ
jgi:lysine/ornithine N-monooxygenase